MFGSTVTKVPSGPLLASKGLATTDTIRYRPPFSDASGFASLPDSPLHYSAIQVSFSYSRVIQQFIIQQFTYHSANHFSVIDSDLLHDQVASQNGRFPLHSVKFEGFLTSDIRGSRDQSCTTSGPKVDFVWQVRLASQLLIKGSYSTVWQVRALRSNKLQWCNPYVAYP